MRFSILSFVLVLCFSTFVRAQVIPFDSDRWITSGKTVVQMTYNGQDALFLHAASAVITDDPILNGEIEFDVAFSAQRGFSGVVWRVHENDDREEFYFRPHLSGFPDANQYNPVLNSVAGWQLYFGPSYSAPIRYRHNEWMHVKVVFYGSKADIYVDSEEPVLSVALKNPPVPGSVGVYASSFSPAYFANFQYRRLDAPVAMGTPIPEPAAADGSIMTWDVSSSFEEAGIDPASDLPGSLSAGLSWSSVPSESTGIVNFARYATFGEGKNTVLAKTEISADSGSRRTVRFGYSDRVKVFLNGKLLYTGTNAYQSRDYRYLGTIGLFDALPLDLRRGTNELVFAVSEDFGGWGLQAVLE